ncbi:hypothetical protein LJC71_02675 [Desulfosarcina sp. OttesenSCG-928-A07]|nr:hypothetical protein [Desulfosarcina sp. OttesenSCG-928-G17]MDL2328641.1 hypothetical protein [Desulfosarcina sp. OttesenSCG-928-A07]
MTWILLNDKNGCFVKPKNISGIKTNNKGCQAQDVFKPTKFSLAFDFIAENPLCSLFFSKIGLHTFPSALPNAIRNNAIKLFFYLPSLSLRRQGPACTGMTEIE